MGDVINVDNLTKKYEDFSLDGISFTVPTGKVTGFIGANGAGKTTTIRCLLNLAIRDLGSVHIFGQNINEHEQEIKDRIGVVLDGGRFYETLSMRDMKNILAPAYTRWDEDEYRMYMDRFRLNDRQKILTLSTGMKAKFSLVLALSHHADLLILDEPTSGLDPLVRSQFLDVIGEFMEREYKSVFFSSHITSDLDKAADHLILIDKGRIVFQNSKDDMLSAYRVVKGFSAELTDEIKGLFLGFKESSGKFTAVTVKENEVKEKLPDVTVEKATVEDVMLAHIKGTGNGR